ncbi:hypothetical protein LX36DRAFT_129439 [Colletotrichum falcatum]|nr:hypothetical protein LX36DRAFT_129439 [Colletotrichum falcatum]
MRNGWEKGVRVGGAVRCGAQAGSGRGRGRERGRGRGWGGGEEEKEGAPSQLCGVRSAMPFARERVRGRSKARARARAIVRGSRARAEGAASIRPGSGAGPGTRTWLGEDLRRSRMEHPRWWRVAGGSFDSNDWGFRRLD